MTLLFPLQIFILASYTLHSYSKQYYFIIFLPGKKAEAKLVNAEIKCGIRLLGFYSRLSSYVILTSHFNLSLSLPFKRG